MIKIKKTKIAEMAIGVIGIFFATSCGNDDFYGLDYMSETSSSINSDHTSNFFSDYNNYNRHISINFNKSELTDADKKNVEIVEKRILENLKITKEGTITFKGITSSDLNIDEEIFTIYTNLLEGQPVTIINDSKSKRIKRLKNRSPETGGGTQGSFWYNIIINRLDSQIEKDHFTHWWEGTGNALIISNDNWTGIKSEAESLRSSENYIGDTIINGTTYQIHQIDFYNNETYDFAFGVSTMYFIGSTAYGLYDYYDFDTKPWGVRAILTEAEIRIVAQLGQSYGAKDYYIYYGVH